MALIHAQNCFHSTSLFSLSIGKKVKTNERNDEWTIKKNINEPIITNRYELITNKHTSTDQRKRKRDKWIYRKQNQRNLVSRFFLFFALGSVFCVTVWDIGYGFCKKNCEHFKNIANKSNGTFRTILFFFSLLFRFLLILFQISNISNSTQFDMMKTAIISYGIRSTPFCLAHSLWIQSAQIDYRGQNK